MICHRMQCACLTYINHTSKIDFLYLTQYIMEYYLHMILPFIPDDWRAIVGTCRASMHSANFHLDTLTVCDLTAFMQLVNKYKITVGKLIIQRNGATQFSAIRNVGIGQVVARYKMSHIPDFHCITTIVSKNVTIGKCHNIYMYVTSRHLVINLTSDINNLCIYSSKNNSVIRIYTRKHSITRIYADSVYAISFVPKYSCWNLMPSIYYNYDGRELGDILKIDF